MLRVGQASLYPPAMSLDPLWPVLILVSIRCLLSQEHFSLPGNAVEENQKVKTQWPRSADEPGVYMAQTGTSVAPAQDTGGTGLGSQW